MKLAPICACLLLLSSCGNPEVDDVLTVAAVAKNLRSLDGRIVRVRGRLGGCDGGFDCRLTDLSHKDKQGFSVSLGIDFVPAIEPILGAAHGKEVVLEARVTDDCADHGCTDRAPDLVPIRILKEF